MASSFKCPWGVKAQFTIPFKSLFYYRTDKRPRPGPEWEMAAILRRARWHSRCAAAKVTLDTDGSAWTRLIALFRTAPWSRAVGHLAAAMLTPLCERTIKQTGNTFILWYKLRPDTSHAQRFIRSNWGVMTRAVRGWYLSFTLMMFDKCPSHGALARSQWPH